MKKGIKIFFGIILVAALIIPAIYFFKARNSEVPLNQSIFSSNMLTLAKGIILGNKTFLVLFQNNMELRPGGGFIGSFAIVKTENGKIKSYAVHDTSNFDGRIPDNKEMPEPMKKIFRIDAWKLRDSNYSPDFPTNVKKALEFYYQGQGEEKFDGVVAVNAVVMESLLEITGPIRLDGYPNIFESETVMVSLEKQVEIDFNKQGIDRGDRKDIMNDFLSELLKKSGELSSLDKIKLIKNIGQELDNKNIQLYFNDAKLQEVAKEATWDGEMDTVWEGDYLMAVDANLGAYKSDYVIERSMQYSLDLSKNLPEATLKITYKHNGKTKDWMIQDYLTYLRVYLPKGSKIVSSSEVGELAYGEEFNKKFMGQFIKVPINSSKTVEIKYTLPVEFKNKEYQLKIQKQSGVNELPIVGDIILADGRAKHFETTLTADRAIK